MIEFIVGGIVLPVAIMMLHERAEQLSASVIQWAARGIESDELAEQWLADSRDIDGGTWKLLHAVGIALKCSIPIALNRLQTRQTDAHLSRSKPESVPEGAKPDQLGSALEPVFGHANIILEDVKLEATGTVGSPQANYRATHRILSQRGPLASYGLKEESSDLEVEKKKSE